MLQKAAKNEKFLKCIPYLMIAGILLIGYLLYSVASCFLDDAVSFNIVLLGCAAILFVLAIYLIGRKKALTTTEIVMVLIFIGLLLRLAYMLLTPYYLRQHDVGGLDDAGHLRYIYDLANFGQLPDGYQNQFYHPPLSHMMEAVVYKIASFFTSYIDDMFNAVKLVPCFLSCALMVVCYKLFKEFHLSDTAMIVAMAFVCFHPTFMILSASINNDMAMIFFFMLSVLYTVRWYKNPSFKNILILAVTIGCAVMSKTSGGLIAVYTGVVFLMVFVKRVREKKGRRTFLQFVTFGVIALPLGLWYPVRNLLLFGQPLTYVARISPTSDLYVGDVSFVDRFLSFPVSEILESPFAHPFEDANVWVYTAKCSLFGEYEFPVDGAMRIILQVLVFINIALILFSLFAMVYVLVKDRVRQNRFGNISMFAIWFLQVASFIYFNIQYPFGCTMDFRYMVPTVITGAFFIGRFFEVRKQNKKETGNLYKNKFAENNESGAF